MTILLSHEMGHFFMSKKYGVPATYPYFIPLPFPPFGTLGAIIKMKGIIINKKALFDIGIAGPLSGFIVSIPFIILGIKLSSIQFVTKEMYPPDLEGIEDLAVQPEILCRGGSTIISPLGEILAGPLYGEEGILFADLDLGEVARGKIDFDAVGHYARPDVFQLIVNERPAPPVSFKKE